MSLPKKLIERIEELGIEYNRNGFRATPRYCFEDGATTRATELWAEIEELRGALEFYQNLPMREQDQLWTQELADKCIDVATKALTKHRDKWSLDE